MAETLSEVMIDSESALWAWLEANHGGPSVWLVTWKKDANPELYLSRDEVLDALTAYGWIDGRRMKRGDGRTMQLIAPRQQQAWARSYKERAQKLLTEGRMKPPGLAAMEAGQASGLWAWSDPIDDLQVPEDLAQALKAVTAEAWFNASAPSYRRNILRFLASAKKAETRAKRIALIAGHAARGEKVPQYG